MARPTDFKEANFTYTKPPGMTDEECVSLRVYRAEGLAISCWRLSWRERIVALLTGRLWLHVLGNGHPPIALETETPFIARLDRASGGGRG